MIRIATAAVLFLLSGCGVYECIDNKIPRQPIAVETPFSINLRVNGQTAEKIVRCERYYDSMCAERGNYWSFRERSSQPNNEHSKFSLADRELGVFEIGIPSCSSMAQGESYPLKYLVIKINGESYWLRSSNGMTRTYATANGKLGSTAKLAIIQLEMKVNGTLVE